MIINLDAPEQGDFGYRRFTFPDGQPHIEFDAEALRVAAARGPIDLVGAVRNGNELLNLTLAVDAIRAAIPDAMSRLSLNISYLLAARMDRRIAPGQPATLDVVASMLNTCTAGFAHVRVLDPHSPATLARLAGAEALHPDALVAYALSRIERKDGQAPIVVVPDAGAMARTLGILSRLKAPHATARCSKKRDSQTGKLSGFQLDEGKVSGRTAVIVDDICDGGGTFSGIAKILRESGATMVYLCVTHGIFSKGLVIDGIDSVFSSDSYRMPDQRGYEVEVDASDAAVLSYKHEGHIRLVLVRGMVERALRGEKAG